MIVEISTAVKIWKEKGVLVARDGIEPPTPAFSGLRSTS
jgi:hypothetical protein